MHFLYINICSDEKDNYSDRRCLFYREEHDGKRFGKGAGIYLYRYRGDVPGCHSLQHGFFTSGGIDEQKLQDAMNDIDISFRFNPETGRPDTYLNGVKVEKEIRGMEVANRVSPIAALGFVRRAMVAKQQEMGKAKGIVMDGRDIGTVVFPDAELKIYVTASPEVRAQRRLDELKAKGEVASFEEVLENVKTRDHIDMTRVESPLRKADDALELDNSHLTIAEQKAWLLEQYEKVVTSD